MRHKALMSLMDLVFGRCRQKKFRDISRFDGNLPPAAAWGAARAEVAVATTWVLAPPPTLCVAGVQPRQALLREDMPGRLKSRGLIECPDMEMRFAGGRGLAFAHQ